LHRDVHNHVFASAMTPSPPARKKRPWWQWVLAGFVGLLILGAVVGDDDEDTATMTSTVTVTQPASSATTTTTTESAESITDAREAVDDGDYARAVAIAAVLGSSEEDAIRRRIANMLARRALAAVRAGDRGTASSVLRQADRYPNTRQLTQARASYRAAKARAAERARAKRLAAEQRREAAAQRRRDAEAAEQAESEAGSGCDPNYSGCVPAYPPDVNCPEVDGPVQVTGSDPHGLDRDGDGVACE
jgi:hypothetical protein